MKLLYTISSVDPVGGGPIESIRQLGLSLLSFGHKVEIASLDPPGAVYLSECQLPVHALGPAVSGYAFTPRFIPWLRVNRSSYDAVVVNGIWQFHSYGTWRALRGSSIPYFVYPHGMLDPWFKKQHPLKHLKKWMYWPWAEYRVLRDAQAVVFTSEEERILARSSFWFYRCNEIVVGLGTSKPQGEERSELNEFFRRYPSLRGKKLLLFMGRIHPKKGCDLLIEAFAQVLRRDRVWHLVMAGPDQLGWSGRLNQRAKELGISSRITWTGMISGALKMGALRAAEALILPSHQENFGMVVPEALAAGVPALISNKINIWREIKASGAGLVAEDTLSGTCQLLQTYLEMTDEIKLAMRKRAYQCFAQRFEITRTAETLSAILADSSGKAPAFSWEFATAMKTHRVSRVQ